MVAKLGDLGLAEEEEEGDDDDEATDEPMAARARGSGGNARFLAALCSSNADAARRLATASESASNRMDGSESRRGNLGVACPKASDDAAPGGWNAYSVLVRRNIDADDGTTVC